MPGPEQFLLIRVDDRLLHGQVALGWGAHLDPRAYIIVDRRLSERPLEAELFRSAAPEGTTIAVYAPEAFLAEVHGGRRWVRAVLLVRDVQALLELVRGGFRPAEVDLGGVHEHGEAVEVLPYLFLDAGDRRDLEEIARAGVILYAQDLPASPRHSWEALRKMRAGERFRPGE